MRCLLALLPVAITGCLIGGGPSIALRSTGRPAVGWELSASLAGAGIEGGQSYQLGEAGRFTYVGLGAFLQTAPWFDSDSYDGPLTDGTYHLGASVGYAAAAGERGAYGAFWPIAVHGETRCRYESRDETYRLATVQVAARWGVGVRELVVMPKLQLYSPFCVE